MLFTSFFYILSLRNAGLHMRDRWLFIGQVPPHTHTLTIIKNTHRWINSFHFMVDIIHAPQQVSINALFWSLLAKRVS